MAAASSRCAEPLKIVMSRIRLLDASARDHPVTSR
jgi:hypothetical protein